MRRRGGVRARRVRRLLALVLVGIAAVLALREQQPGSGESTVLAWARDLPVGTVVAPGDLVAVALRAPPDGALTDPTAVRGRTLNAPVRRGEVLTDARLVPAGGPDAGPGRVAVPVTPADPTTVALLSPGVHVAVLTVDDDGNPTLLTADAVVVALVPPTDDPRRPDAVVLAVDISVADIVAGATLADRVTLRFN
ncbi:flagellar biosynthesis protein FlgA [Nakamurella sp. YIM 132087]|uniref:Flagellar biosynthesis protein FlgA n=2 Tax=Nakamurella alba TaxID=2665158 RepID=A0A7K1FEQ0_9ACTN|nr:flagellar biosynthesis protein FlgA [Nakamurella alba]